MVRDIVSIGDKIDIRRLDNSGKPMSNVKNYVSQLIDFIDNDKANIAMPFDNGRVYLLDTEEKYSLCFFTNKGLFQCNCKVINRFREKNIIIATVQFTSNIEKFQRRQYFRMECVLDAQYHVCSDQEILLQGELKRGEFSNAVERAECNNKLSLLEEVWFKASITDISGGGARFNSNQLHQRGENLKIMFDFGTSDKRMEFVTNAVFVASIKLTNRFGMFEHRIEFTNIGKTEREVIIKYIFEQERRKRNGLRL